MPAASIAVPGITFATTDRGGQYMFKLNAVAAAIDTAIGGYNMQLAAANDAQIHAAALAGSLATAAASATKAGDWAEKAVDVIVETGKYSAKHHATKAAASAVTAGSHATTASTWRQKASDWAEKAEDTLVDPGQYSAKHHALKAAASSVSANTHRANALSSETKAAAWAETAENILVETGKYSAKHHALKAAASSGSANTHRANALASETKAADWAEKAENSTVEAGKYSAKHHALKAEYWANQSAANSSGAMVYVGGFNASSGAWPAGALAGQMYRISVDGTLGPFADSVTRPVKAGDMIIKRADLAWDWFDGMDSQFKDWIKQSSSSDTTAGALLVAGAGGLILPATNSATDANNITIPGTWGTNLTVPSNMPPGFSGRATVTFAGSTTYGYQFAVDSNNSSNANRAAFRIRRGTFDLPWAEFWHSQNLLKQSSASDATAGSVLLTGAGGLLGSALSTIGITDLKTLPFTASFITETSGIVDLPSGWSQGRYYVNQIGKPSESYSLQEITNVSSTANDEICRKAVRRMRNTGVWSDYKTFKFVSDPVERTAVISANTTINKSDTVTRASVYAINSNPGNFTVTIGSGYSAGDSIELDIGIGGAYTITISAAVSIYVAGGTAATSHTLTGPVQAFVRMVFDGSNWLLFIS